MISHSAFPGDPRVRRAAEALARSGHEVDVICLRRTPDEKNFCLNGVNVYGIKERRKNQESVMDNILELSAFFTISTFWVTKLFFQKKYDLIHVHNIPDFQVFAALIPKLFGSKIVLDIHDIVPEFYAQKFHVADDHIVVRLLKWIEKISIAFADHVIVANHIWGKTLASRSVNSEKATVILNAPDDFYFYPRQKPETHNKTFTLVYHGTLKEHFGVDIAVKAVDILRLNIPNVKMKIIGSGPFREKLLELAAELDIEEFVSIYEPVPIDKIREFAIQADVGVVPKRAGIFSDNALSTKLLEYVKLGIPAVVSRTPIAEYYFDENMVRFFEPENPEDLATAVTELYKNPEKRKELVRNANRFNEKHNWEHYRKVYFGVIHNLCSNPDHK